MSLNAKPAYQASVRSIGDLQAMAILCNRQPAANRSALNIARLFPQPSTIFSKARFTPCRVVHPSGHRQERIIA